MAAGGCGWPDLGGLVAIDGLLEPEAGQTVLAALEPLARPTDAHDTRSGAADHRCPGRVGPAGPGRGRLPQAGGSGPSC
jgi:hypothetical protein